MKADVDVTLIHDGTHWVARNDTVTAKGRTLEELDQSLARALRDSGEFPEAASVTVFMGFDYDVIPTWIRQYASHYFNRYVSLRL